MAPNPLRTEGEAFRIFVWVLVAFVAAIALALVVQAL
jgi:NADH:ubiquinone oxidoreductase subunit K